MRNHKYINTQGINIFGTALNKIGSCGIYMSQGGSRRKFTSSEEIGLTGKNMYLEEGRMKDRKARREEKEMTGVETLMCMCCSL